MEAIDKCAACRKMILMWEIYSILFFFSFSFHSLDCSFGWFIDEKKKRKNATSMKFCCIFCHAYCYHFFLNFVFSMEFIYFFSSRFVNAFFSAFSFFILKKCMLTFLLLFFAFDICTIISSMRHFIKFI